MLNSTAAVILEDIYKGCFNGQPTGRAAAFIVKGSILILGVIAMLLLLVVDKLGGILVVATSLSAIAAGTTFGVFTLGMLVPRSNTKGAIVGMAAGALISGWISLGSQISAVAGHLVPHKLGVWISECSALNDSSRQTLDFIVPEYRDESDVFPLYRLSFHWINPIGVLTVLAVGTAISYITGPTMNKDIDSDLISPVIHRYFCIFSFRLYNISIKITPKIAINRFLPAECVLKNGYVLPSDALVLAKSEPNKETIAMQDLIN